MRILMDSHMVGRRQTGIERYWSNLIRELSHKRDIDLIKYSSRNQPQNARLPNKYIPITNMGLYRILFGFQDAINRFKPDLIHVSNFAPLFTNKPVVTTVHDMCYASRDSGFSLKSKIAFNCLLGRSLNFSRAIISVSECTKKKIMERFDINPDKIHVIYEAADPVFEYVQDRSQVRIHLKKVGVGPLYFLVVGNIESRKRPHDIVKAFRKFRNTNSHYQLVFVGPNKLGNKFIQENIDLFRNNSLKLLGYVENSLLNLLYNGARSLLFFSSCEGFGLPLVEAMKCRTPIVCSDIGIFREICASCALYADNPDHLLKALLLIKKREVKNKLSVLSWKRGAMFSWKKAARETHMLYKKHATTKQ